MKIRYLADECLNQRVMDGVLRQEPAVDFLTAGLAGLQGRPDLQLLAFAAAEYRIVITQDVSTMPAVFDQFIAERLSSGLILLSRNLPVTIAVESLVRIWEDETAEDWRNRIVWLPL